MVSCKVTTIENDNNRKQEDTDVGDIVYCIFLHICVILYIYFILCISDSQVINMGLSTLEQFL